MSEVRIINERTGGEKSAKPQRMDLLPWDVLMQDVAPLYAEGAKKYSDHNWRRGFAWSLSIAALARHFAAFVHGEDYDPETGRHHLASVVFHALALLHFNRYHRDLDDRWTPERAGLADELTADDLVAQAVPGLPARPKTETATYLAERRT